MCVAVQVQRPVPVDPDWPAGGGRGVGHPHSGPLRCRRVDHQVQHPVSHCGVAQLDLLQRPNRKQQGEHTTEVTLTDDWLETLNWLNWLGSDRSRSDCDSLLCDWWQVLCCDITYIASLKQTVKEREIFKQSWDEQVTDHKEIFHLDWLNVTSHQSWPSLWLSKIYALIWTQRCFWTCSTSLAGNRVLLSSRAKVKVVFHHHFKSPWTETLEQNQTFTCFLLSQRPPPANENALKKRRLSKFAGLIRTTVSVQGSVHERLINQFIESVKVKSL